MDGVYHDVDAATHQANVNDYKRRGYRPIDVSVSGTPPNVRYAAVWIRNTSNIGWQMRHGDSPTEYMSHSNSFISQGFSPTRISVTGATDHAITAGIWDNTMTSQAVVDIKQEDLISRVGGLGNNVWMLKEYGTFPTDRRYAVIVLTGSTNINTAWFYGVDHWNLTLYKIAYCNWRQPANWTCVSATANGNSGSYCVTFANLETSQTSVDTQLTRSEMQTTLSQLQSRQFTPYSLQAYGDFYTLLGAHWNPPLPRRWNQHSDLPSMDAWPESPTTEKLDQAMATYMKSRQVRYGQLAIGRAGTVHFARSYSWTAQIQPPLSTTNRMLLASVSKAFLCAVVQVAYDEKKLQSTTKVFSLLGITPHDTRANAITVQQLVDHTSGLPTNDAADPVFKGREVAAEINHSNHPATALEIVKYTAARDLPYDPGADYHYSNVGYVVLSEVVRQAYGYGSYYDLLKDKILTPEGLDVQVWTTKGPDHYNDAMAAEGKYEGPSSIILDNDLPNPDIYGGDGMVKEACTGPSSLAASSRTLVKFLSKHSAWGLGSRSVHSREGEMNGSRSVIWSRPDGLDLAIILNTDLLQGDDSPDNPASFQNFYTKTIGGILDAGGPLN